MTTARHPALPELEAGLDHVLAAPTDEGTLELIVRRPAVGEREVLERATLSLLDGLEGDTWKTRGSKQTDDGAAHPLMQLNLMCSRVAALVAQDAARWPLAGDQLYLDLDLSVQNLPPGSRLELGSAVIEITAAPHLGCKKFSARFGVDALRFVNSKRGKELRLRGVNARVVQPGTIERGAKVRKRAWVT